VDDFHKSIYKIYIVESNNKQSIIWNRTIISILTYIKNWIIEKYNLKNHRKCYLLNIAHMKNQMKITVGSIISINLSPSTDQLQTWGQKFAFPLSPCSPNDPGEKSQPPVLPRRVSWSIRPTLRRKFAPQLLVDCIAIRAVSNGPDHMTKKSIIIVNYGEIS